jgi:hypothetical protein
MHVVMRVRGCLMVECACHKWRMLIVGPLVDQASPYVLKMGHHGRVLRRCSKACLLRLA